MNKPGNIDIKLDHAPNMNCKTCAGRGYTVDPGNARQAVLCPECDDPKAVVHCQHCRGRGFHFSPKQPWYCAPCHKYAGVATMDLDPPTPVPGIPARPAAMRFVPEHPAGNGRLDRGEQVVMIGAFTIERGEDNLIYINDLQTGQGRAFDEFELAGIIRDYVERNA